MTAAVPRPPEGKKGVVEISAVEDMSDYGIVRHFVRHGVLDITPEDMVIRGYWETVHARSHKEGGDLDHVHKQPVKRRS